MNDIKESLNKILDISIDSIIEEQNFLNLVLSDSPEGKILKNCQSLRIMEHYTN